MSFFSSKEVALNFGVSRRTVQRWIQQGEFFEVGDYIKAGRSYKIYPHAVQRLQKKFENLS